MIIPKGKKFLLLAEQPSNVVGRTNLVKIPSSGYMGNAYISQDVNISVNNNYAAPLEGLLDAMPNSVDFLMRAKTGGSGLKNNKYLSYKYWTGSDPMSFDIQFVFETQVDSYYDVFYPIMNLYHSVTPAVTSDGFLIPPVKTLKYFADAVGAAQTFVGKFSSNDPTLANLLATARSLVNSNPVEKLKDGISQAESKATELSLYIGKNFYFSPVLVKSMTVDFSSELCYAPFKVLGQRPSDLGELIAKLVCQYVGTTMATAANVAGSATAALNSLGIPSPLKDTLNTILDIIPSFPIKATVNMSVETQSCITHGGGSDQDIEQIFRPHNGNAPWGIRLRHPNSDESEPFYS